MNAHSHFCPLFDANPLQQHPGCSELQARMHLTPKPVKSSHTKCPAPLFNSMRHDPLTLPDPLTPTTSTTAGFALDSLSSELLAPDCASLPVLSRSTIAACRQGGGGRRAAPQVGKQCLSGFKKGAWRMERRVRSGFATIWCKRMPSTAPYLECHSRVVCSLHAPDLDAVPDAVHHLERGLGPKIGRLVVRGVESRVLRPHGISQETWMETSGKGARDVKLVTLSERMAIQRC